MYPLVDIYVHRPITRKTPPVPSRPTETIRPTSPDRPFDGHSLVGNICPRPTPGELDLWRVVSVQT